jgi:hypothetical protein
MPVATQRPALNSLERSSNSCALAGTVQGGFYFRPGDEDLSLGTPFKEKAIQRLWFRGKAIGEPL